MENPQKPLMSNYILGLGSIFLWKHSKHISVSSLTWPFSIALRESRANAAVFYVGEWVFLENVNGLAMVAQCVRDRGKGFTPMV